MNWIKINNNMILNLDKTASLDKNNYDDPACYTIESEDGSIFSSESKTQRDKLWNKIMEKLKL